MRCSLVWANGPLPSESRSSIRATSRVPSAPHTRSGQSEGDEAFMHRKRAPIAFAAVAVLAAGCGSTKGSEAAWRDPTLSSSMRSAGQTVVSENVVTVAATAPWVHTGLSIVPGEHLWADTRTDGKWSGNPKYFPYSDANGSSIYPGQYRVDANALGEALISFIGNSPPTPEEVAVHAGAAPGGPGGSSNPGFVDVGDTLLDYAPNTTGMVWLRNNDNTNSVSDVGQQVVNVVVTR